MEGFFIALTVSIAIVMILYSIRQISLIKEDDPGKQQQMPIYFGILIMGILQLLAGMSMSTVSLEQSTRDYSLELKEQRLEEEEKKRSLDSDEQK